MNDITQLAPQTVWQWFAKICAIPHPSFHEAELVQFIIDQVQTEGKSRGMTVERDSKNNLHITKPASKGMENRAPVALQAHCDMVAQKADDSTHDFIKDPIQPRIQDQFVYANHTTLGADNGIGLAMALAVAFSDDIAHPELHIIITTEEETSMGGVNVLQPEWLSAPYLLNLDTEDDAQIFVGCAGGCDATFTRQYPQHAYTGKTLSVKVSGLRGGHSGVNIHEYRGNANLVLTRVLQAANQVAPVQLIAFNGGTVINAIPRSAEAIIVGDESVIAAIEAEAKIIQTELHAVERSLKVECTAQETTATVLSQADTQHFLDFVSSFPNGVLRMSDDFAGIVETSINAGVVTLEQGDFALKTLMRSLGEMQKQALKQRLAALSRLAGVEMHTHNDYPGWLPDPQSKLLELVKPLMATEFGREPTVQVIHAGLECGYLKSKAPHMDMVSFGPNIFNAHSPTEHVQIDSVAKNFELLKKVLLAIPAK
ncbi:aminoacyl-histidine dipeptidase [Kingella negevensis]|uniref:aminoacyl-histidine dipeptidase n=1 Tax=Kingella negevensis TaxID=1522312 RepID=UPI002543E31B|nr:aminoacyl-histidine dipeptidase [Kingella negevensis]WII92768.1 aminoacyl-histidine dipeptidase [Kingella negevensis]